MTKPSRTETEAILYVLKGNHPGNVIPGCPLFNPKGGDAGLKDFIENYIPKDWPKFCHLCELIYTSTLW